MPIDPVSAVLSPVAGLVGSVLGFGGASENTRAQREINEKNLAFQREVQDYQKGVQKTTWQREDDAIGRRVADLRAAGLSPVLAAGAAAQTSAPIQLQPMRSEFVPKDLSGIQHAMSGIMAASQLSQTIAATRLTEA